MGTVLYLVHRLPYPPNKGDKIRSFHLLRHLQQHHRVFLGAFVDDPADQGFIPALRRLCPDAYIESIAPLRAVLRRVKGWVLGQPLTVATYTSRHMQAWVNRVFDAHAVDACVVVSTSMAIYLENRPAGVPVLLDAVDVDSEKWHKFSKSRPWPWSWVFAREARLLASHEKAMVGNSHHSFFVTDLEVDLFRSQAAALGGKVSTMSNGVDADFFVPDPGRGSPFPAGQLSLVFVGTMDYWPNIDAVDWFVRDVLPLLREVWPALVFYVVGRKPAPSVLALSSQHVRLTGAVEDVRPYLQHAAAVVAPMRVSQGLPNKILEAMASAQPVVVSTVCSQVFGLDEAAGMLSASSVAEYVQQVGRLLGSPALKAELGQRARNHVCQHFRWNTQLSVLDRYLPANVEPVCA